MTEFAIRRLDRSDLPAIVTVAAGLDWNDEEHRYQLLFDHEVSKGGSTSLMALGVRHLPGDRQRLYMPVTPALG